MPVRHKELYYEGVPLIRVAQLAPDAEHLFRWRSGPLEARCSCRTCGRPGAPRVSKLRRRPQGLLVQLEATEELPVLEAELQWCRSSWTSWACKSVASEEQVGEEHV